MMRLLAPAPRVGRVRRRRLLRQADQGRARSGDGRRGHGAARLDRAAARRCARASAGAWPPSSSRSRAQRLAALDARQDQDAGGGGAQAHRAQRDRRQHRRQGAGARRARGGAARRGDAAVGARGLLRARRRALSRARRRARARRRGARARRASGARRRRAPALRPRRGARHGARACPYDDADARAGAASRRRRLGARLRRRARPRGQRHPRRGAAAQRARRAGRALRPSRRVTTASARSCSMPCSAPRDWRRRSWSRRWRSSMSTTCRAARKSGGAPSGSSSASCSRAPIAASARGTSTRRATPSARSPTPPARSRRTSATSTCGCAQGATPAELRAEYDRRAGATGAVAEFVDAYLLARELPSLTRRRARKRAIDDAVAELRRASTALRGKPEPQVVWGALLHERFLDDGDARLGAEGEPALSARARPGGAQSALSLAHPRRSWRSCSRRSATTASRSATSPIATSCPSPTTPAGVEHRLIKARTLMHLDREDDAAAAADEALAVVERTPALAELRPLVLDRDALYHLAAGRFPRALALYDRSCRSVDGERNLVVAHLARAGAALGADQRAPRGRRPRRRRCQAARRPARRRARLAAHHAGDDAARLSPHRRRACAPTPTCASASSTPRRPRSSVVAGSPSSASPPPASTSTCAALGLVEARLADVARDRHDVAGANRWLGLALDRRRRLPAQDRRAAARRQLDLLRLAADLRLDGQLTQLAARICRTASTSPSATWPPRATRLPRRTSAGLEIDAAALAPAVDAML